ncbi:PH domain-containing protein [Clostridiales bacterium COT073_COT-073]|nr:PH domain-containing protein [Clostridiales bacterium COT073_COT-073]
MGHPFFYIFALIWGTVDLLIFGTMTLGALQSEESIFFIFIALFFILHMTPVWIALILPVYNFFAWKAVDYVVTSKRIYLQSGLIGRDITSLEYPEIGNLMVDVGMLEKMKGVGTVRLTPDVSTGSGKRRTTHRGNRLKHIENPYEVYKMIKQITMDISTDYHYPNAYRPNSNAGYQTRYQPGYQSGYQPGYQPTQSRSMNDDIQNQD